MILVSVDIDTFLWYNILSYFLTTTQSLNSRNVKGTSDVVFVRSLPEIVLSQYVMGDIGDETATKNS